MNIIRKYLKVPLIPLFIISMILGNSPLYAYNGYINNNFGNDYILLNDGTLIEGNVVKFGTNSFKVNTKDGKMKIENSEVKIVGFSQELSEAEKYRLGRLDGKRYAINKGGNLALGFLFPVLGTILVYVTSEQDPSYKAIAGKNKAIINDMNYIRGYEKGARKKSGSQALIGAGVAVLLLVGLGVLVSDEIDDIYNY